MYKGVDNERTSAASSLSTLLRTSTTTSVVVIHIDPSTSELLLVH